MAHFGQVWIYYAVVGGGMGTSSGCASFFVQNSTFGEKTMKTSYVWTIIASIIIVSACVFWGYSCHSSRQARKTMIYVLEQDKCAHNGASTVTEYVKNLKSISLLNCPSDFTMAYRRHQAAWEDMKSVEEEAKYFQRRYNSGGAFLEAVLRGMIFDFSMVSNADEAQKRLINHYRSAEKNIRDTFHEAV